MTPALTVNEIFLSIQGESSRAGYPCTFIRLTGCKNTCHWCDTRYAMHEGQDMTLQHIIDTVDRHRTSLVEITGGEPLQQPGVHPLMQELCNRGYNVMLETGGFISVRNVDPRVHKIIDLKTPSSGVSHNNCQENIELALQASGEHKTTFEFKIVIADRRDYDWATSLISRCNLDRHCTIIMGTVFGHLPPADLASWILSDHLNVRLQLQLHKYIWPPHTRGV